MRRFLVLAVPLMAALLMPNAAQAQTREITGKVTISGTTAPLADAIIGVVGAAGGARSNDEGVFRLRVPAGDATIQVRAIGYKRQQVRVPASQSTVDFALEKDVLQLEGVTVTGAATTIERRNAATSVAAVNTEELVRVPAPAVESALQGKVVGASINMNNGAPGGGGQVQIRGASSLIGNTQPLFVIDGVAISNSVRSNRMGVVTGSLNSGEENGTNRLADINPSDIENIEVLKGAAASAIYGSQATNGVVVITTKRGQAGAPRFNVTQRVGTYQLIRKLGQRHFEDLSEVLSVVGGAEATAAATAACTPKCTYQDYQQQLYGQTDPTYETALNFSGGVNNTRYFFSGLSRQEKGIMINTSALRQSLRGNLDQQIGDKISVSLGSTIMRSFSQRGVSNNDNALSSPIYGLAYAPPVVDLRKRDAQGRYVLNAFPSGSKNTSNPFQTMALMLNNEDVYRLIFSSKVNYSAYTSEKNVLNLSLLTGSDRFSSENYVYAPSELQFQRQGTVQAGQFPGTIIQGNGTSLLTNAMLSGTWQNSSLSFVNATTSVGLQFESSEGNDYNIIGRGLGPQQKNAAGAVNTAVSNSRSLIRSQAAFVQEDLLMFNERLFLSGAVRAEKSSVNGFRDTVYYFPRAQASWRMPNPINHVNEFKLRLAYGQSGNRPNYGERDLTIASYGLIGGLQGFGLPGTVGNPLVKPEVMNEVEGGFDASLFSERVRLEVTRYDRRITDLLVRPQLAPSTGITATTKNGGKMRSIGYEVAATVVPLQTANFTWTNRTTWFQNKATITSFPAGVRPFRDNTAARGFGNAYGQLFYTPGTSVSTIWGNVTTNGVTKAQVPVGDANPHYVMSFSNDFNYKSFNLNILADYRHGGDLSNMTLNLHDEGQTTWDYEDKSPQSGVPLGEYRYDTWNGGGHTPMYISDGSFTKIREINLSYDLPHRFYSLIPGARNGRVSLAGRNLFIISGYNGFDPEVNNGGNYVVRFVDLAPFPPARSFFLSFDFGF
ncbi:MAG: hypothetical protein MNPFHGCM_00540 [Gemmatimonadaceae bacterium]|nr:hypothetical protein [Gemmatimonadaceae bacterium]